MLAQFLQTLASQKSSAPLVEKVSAEFSIHRNGGLIPVEHSPANERAVLLFGHAGNASYKSLADSSPAKLGTDKQVLQIQSGASPDRVVAEEQREAGSRASPFSDSGR